jgi:hypothetical protein
MLSKSVEKDTKRKMRELYAAVLQDLSRSSVTPTSKQVMDSFVLCNEILIAVSSDSMQLTQTKLFEAPETLL